MDCEMLQQMSWMLKPIDISREEIGVETLAEVGPGGHFLGSPHTMARYREAFYQPFLSDWQNHENWILAGAKNATQRATETWQRALREYQKPQLDPGVREALDTHVVLRKESLGRREPALEPVPA
jgi:trimethylamine--corrinoid protein Co-methyltransferase